MKRLIMKLTLISATLIFLMTGVGAADEQTGYRQKHSIKSIQHGGSHQVAQPQHYNHLPRHGSNYRNRDDFERGRHFSDRRHYRRHDRRHDRWHHRRHHYRDHHYRHRHHRRHHYHHGRYCDRPHFRGYFVDPGLFFSFGWSDRW